MGLNAQAPTRVAQTIVDSQLGVALRFGTIHRLQKEMPEIELLKFLGRGVLLRINELELAAGDLHEGGARLWTDTDPVERRRRRTSPVGLHGHLEVTRV